MEIERKFLPQGPLTKSELAGKSYGMISQSYLSNGLRVRHEYHGTSTYTITLKQNTPQPFSRLEWEEQIPYWVYKELSSSQGAKHLTKHRYTWEEDDKKFEYDVFCHPKGIILLEIEFKTIEDALSFNPRESSLPILREVTYDPAYQNYNIAMSQ